MVRNFPGTADAAPRTEPSPGGKDDKDKDKDREVWRGELSARLNRYRRRHKAPPPRYPSLQLPVGQDALALETQILAETPTGVLASTVEDSRPDNLYPVGSFGVRLRPVWRPSAHHGIRKTAVRLYGWRHEFVPPFRHGGSCLGGGFTDSGGLEQ